MTAPLTEEIGVGLVEFLKGLRDEYDKAGRPLEAMGFSGAAKSVQKLLDERRELREALLDPVFLNHSPACIDRRFHGQCDCGVQRLNERRRALLAAGEEERT